MLFLSGDCGSDQSYYNLEVFAQHPQARSKCQALGLNLATPLSMQDLDKLDDINYDDNEYWTEIRNFGGLACVDDDCDNRELTTADNQTISLTPFGDIAISSHKQCVVGRDERIISKECDHEKQVICQSSCTWFPPTFSISTSPSTPTEVDVPPSTSSPFTCQPMMSILSPINSKFYKALNQSTEFLDANQVCVASEMELASIQSDEDLQSVLETLGSGSFWVSLYNPNLVPCDSSLTCSIKLRDSFGQIFNSMGLSAEFQITPKRCIRLSINATFTRFESEDCDANYPSACESTCGLGTPGIKVSNMHMYVTSFYWN
ncbi:hypothetical protein TCAL_12784 [Tigriopus californicus]|uniref:C-type lectin domain-containing protein n=1 Tax=Tigriopus californicus TaxID=6832 RepID=A0A553N6Q4_TIGCA|nr:hypothetical protein TCAL_12784 [Tigriopus californicus]|eukprot:TCALIF_12784-PA protein Name:"Protein of unknown function" AED:0.24 eAED:0.24 QI:0/0.5/0/0.66/0/0.66/3/0/317